MPAGVVFVTATDYVTVYPTVLETATLPSSTLLSSATMTLLPSFELLVPTLTTLVQSTVPFQPQDTASAEPSLTKIPPLPSGWPTPIMGSETKPWNDQLAGLSLAAVILMVLLLLILFGYAIYQRFHGKCHHCGKHEKELEKWRKGDLKIITKEMVKSRESLNSSRSDSAPNGAHADLERGDADKERQVHHAKALAALTRPSSVLLKPSLWERAKGMMKPKYKTSKHSPENRPSTVGDRFFTLSNVETLAPALPQADYMLPQTTYEPPQTTREPLQQNYTVDPVIDRAYSPPSPSVYSRATDYLIQRPGSQQSEHYNPPLV
jgi:hypothetical protein